MSKMGISTLRSYRSAQVFEAVGLGEDFVHRHFPGTASRIQGIGLAEIAAEANERHKAACATGSEANGLLPSGGFYRFRKDGERHRLSAEAIVSLQEAVRKNDAALYQQYAAMVNSETREAFALRGLLVL